MDCQIDRASYRKFEGCPRTLEAFRAVGQGRHRVGPRHESQPSPHGCSVPLSDPGGMPGRRFPMAHPRSTASLLTSQGFPEASSDGCRVLVASRPDCGAIHRANRGFCTVLETVRSYFSQPFAFFRTSAIVHIDPLSSFDPLPCLSMFDAQSKITLFHHYLTKSINCFSGYTTGPIST